MASDDMDDYLIYQNRLASFTAPQTLSWPHKSLTPEGMANAGFIFQPNHRHPDNATCFLCSKALDGWEENDSPLDEHLKHSPECGWAITAAVEAELGTYAMEDPRDPLMVEARKATFAGRWPHEGKKGWSCKTKQLVEAGWKYTPLNDSADNVTCAYCQLSLDNWEKSDKPWDEHYSRRPQCRFFSLISSKPAPKRAGQSKAARSSKASRLSLQSVAGISDLTSVADVTADIDDSVMTTASNMTTASKASKKTAKGKKPAVSRVKKTRAKKSEVVEIFEDEPPAQKEEISPPPSPRPTKGKKRTSSEMEGSTEIAAEAPARKKRATKTRKARDSGATEISHADTEVTDAPEPVGKKPAAKRATRKASGTRKASSRSTRKGSVATTASTASPPPQLPDDNEIDRQLQADLERPLTDGEDHPADADPETKKAAAARKRQSVENAGSAADPLAKTLTTDFAMFDPEPAQPTDAQIEADLRSMQNEMDVDRTEPKQEQEPEPEPEPEPEELKVPKKGRKTGTRKTSKQAAAAAKKGKEEAAPAEPAQLQTAAEAEEPDEIAEAEVSFVTNSTTVRRSVGRASLGNAGAQTTAKPAAKRGRPPKKKVSQGPIDEPAEVTTAPPPEPAVEPESQPQPQDMQVDEDQTPVLVQETQKQTGKAKRGRPPKKTKNTGVSSEEPTLVAPATEPQPEPEPEPEPVQMEVDTEKTPTQENTPVADESAANETPKIFRKPVPAPQGSPFAIQRKPVGPISALESPIPSGPPQTPRHLASPVQSAKQATVSPSPTPQASDAENRPPSSRPNTNSSRGKRISLPIRTPERQRPVSPSKQQPNVVSGLQSTEEWTAVDLELVFENQENAGAGSAASRFFANAGNLTDLERNMTVEEWVYHNASQAEQKLKHECEAMVMAFEKEGTRAMRVLEGLVVE